ncbi:MAG: response regulator transcription factor [Limnobacter sp.]|jgi:two-component system response regulator RegA|uniref:response regulator transcription factor n=1 Tax=Limnobacter sp. TaxID=2003368 RepID=UPI003919E4A5
MSENGRQLLIVEDDASFAKALSRSFERRGYSVIHAANHDAMVALLDMHQPTHAVIDMKLDGKASGLTCVQTLHQRYPDTLIVVLTGFASINTAVEAVKLGACQYLAKPSNTDDIEAAFNHVAGAAEPEITARPTSIKNLEWERIHEMLVQTDFNISETARRLGMHRRTLARKLEKQRIK